MRRRCVKRLDFKELAQVYRPVVVRPCTTINPSYLNAGLIMLQKNDNMVYADGIYKFLVY